VEDNCGVPGIIIKRGVRDLMHAVLSDENIAETNVECKDAMRIATNATVERTSSDIGCRRPLFRHA
jgi:hypothetical protein